MPISVHIPEPLLQALDRHARRLGVSRDRVIVRALQRELGNDVAWSEGFFETLRAVQARDRSTVARMVDEVRSRRRSKAAPKL